MASTNSRSRKARNWLRTRRAVPIQIRRADNRRAAADRRTQQPREQQNQRQGRDRQHHVGEAHQHASIQPDRSRRAPRSACRGRLRATRRQARRRAKRGRPGSAASARRGPARPCRANERHRSAPGEPMSAKSCSSNSKGRQLGPDDHTSAMSEQEHQGRQRPADGEEATGEPGPVTAPALRERRSSARCESPIADPRIQRRIGEIGDDVGKDDSD